MHAEEDKKKKELIEARNMADTLSYSTEKAIKDAGDKLTEDEKKPVEEKIEALKQVKDGDDVEAIKKATEELSTAAQAIGQKLYQAAQEAAQPGTDASGENVKDAEVTDDASQSEAQAEEGKPEGEEKKTE